MCLAVPSDGTTTAALLTEAKGTVYKRGFIDWSKEKWGDPSPAKVGDVLEEGMQVGTGDKSWAQIAWQYVTCRAWANSVYAIAPHQRLVYLSNGEMLFHLDKNRKDKDKDQYCLWTNLLQARIRGTTVLVQATPDRSRITVLEGTVDVLNKLDHSVVRIRPGVVLEVQAKINTTHNDTLNQSNLLQDANTLKTANNIEQALSLPATVSAAGDAAGKAASEQATDAKVILPGAVSTAETIPQQLTNIASGKEAIIPLFDDVRSTTNLLVANVDMLLNHGLVNGLESELSSLPLVKDSLQELPTLFHEGNAQVLDVPLSAGKAVTDNPLITSAAEILRTPTKLAYDVGPNVGGLIHISPSSVALFPPQAIIGAAKAVGEQAYANSVVNGLHINQAGHRVLSLTDPLFRLPVTSTLISPQLPGGANLPGATATAGGGLLINNSVLVSRTLGTVGIASAASLANLTASSPLLNGTLGGIGGLAGVHGLTGVTGLTGITGVNGLTGVTGLLGLGGLTGGLGNTLTGTLGGVGGIVTGLGGTVGGTLNGVGSTLGGTLGGTVSNLGTGLGGTVSGLGGTVNNLGGTLGGLLGGHH